MSAGAPAPIEQITRDPAALALLFRDLANAAGAVLAVSGGPDSTALMHLAAHWKGAGASLPVAVACVDHGLRPEARLEAERVVTSARTLGLEAATLVWSGEVPRRAIQERARDIRYTLLARYAEERGATHLVTAHTLDDQAETLLFRMSRGSGIKGLGGMKRVSWRGSLHQVRPLLHLRKADLLALCVANHWAYVDDPSNTDPRFARTRWRRLLPELAAEGLTPERLDVLAERLARADEALDAVTAGVLRAATLALDTGSARTFSMVTLASQPQEIVMRAIGAVLAEPDGSSPLRLQRLERLAKDLLDAQALDRPLRRTLCHHRVSLSSGKLSIAPEGLRKRGR